MADAADCCSIAARPATSPPCWRSAGNIRSAPGSARRWRSGLPISRYRAAGNHVFGVYLLAQLCAVVTFWTLLSALARHRRRPAGGARGAARRMTVVAFSSPGVEFGPLVLARPLWALLLLHSWQLIGQNRRSAWFAWSIEAGLLLLTTSAAIGLLLLVVGFAVATAARPAHADVARSALCAAGDRRAGAALSDLAAARRCAGAAAVAGDRRSQRARACIGPGCLAACCWRCPPSCCW